MHCTFWFCLYFIVVAWATNNTTDNPSTLSITVASSLHFTFLEGIDGRVGFFIRDDIDFKVLPQPCFNTFECISVHLSMGNAQDIIFYMVYSPPNVSKANFIEDFSSFVDGAALSCCANIILGDLNLPLDKQDGWSMTPSVNTQTRKRFLLKKTSSPDGDLS